MWLILPGWGLAPDDYASLAKGLGSDANVVDSWRTPTTGDISAVRAALGADDSEIDLIGHSIGGLAGQPNGRRHTGRRSQAEHSGGVV